MQRLFFLFFTLSSLLIFGCSESKTQGMEESTCDCSFDPIAYEQRYKDMTDVHFMVTADPQYHYKEMNPDLASVKNSDLVSTILAQKICCEHSRGVIISGDLTHRARPEEYVRYEQFIKAFKPFVFDGLGNHDLRWAKKEAMKKEAFAEIGLGEVLPFDKLGFEYNCLNIIKDVRDRKRIVDLHSSYPNIHYSWDWENLHCIQLNLFPGSETIKGRPAQNPFDAITFLKKDLETQVGNSGRPIILSHHYGVDFFSIGAPEEGSKINPEASWWTPEDRQRYWDLIEPYNVIAIFSGHAHYCDECYLPWDGQSIGEKNVGPDFIPTFVAGAAREGKYLECQVTSDSLIVKRFDKKDLLFRKAFAITR